MQPKPISRRGDRLTMLAAKTLLVVISIALLLVWLGFGQGTGDFGSAVRREFTRSTGFCLSCRKADVDPTISFVKSALDSADIPAEIEQKARTFAADNGLQIQLDGDSFRYLLFVKNERLELFTTPATAEGLTSAADKLDQAVNAKLAEMATAPCNAKFARENELVEKQKSKSKDGTTTDTDKLILARRPKLGELYGVEAALKRSRPSNMAAGDKTGLKIYFLKDSLYKEESHFAYFTTDKDGRPAIYVNAGTTDGLRPTELDAPSWALSTRFGRDGTFFDTVESLFLHELAHNHQARMAWDKDEAAQKQMNAALGFVSYVDDKTRQTVYLIEVRAADDAADKSLRYFRLSNRSVAEKDKRWYRTDTTGAYLDAAGKIVDSEEKAFSLSNKEVQARALVPPSSNYFDTPSEIYAEAMKALRMGGEARQSLLALSPALYKIVLEEDQKELNAAFGYVKVTETRTLVKAGQESALAPSTRIEPTFMRGWDGLIVPYSPAAASALQQAETQAHQLISTSHQG